MNKLLKLQFALILVSTILISCGTEAVKDTPQENKNPLAGTWKLIKGTLIEKGDTAITDYTKNKSFIKIINDTHFAFLQHDIIKGKDSTAGFSAGGGIYSLKDSLYTEHLEYCSAPEWEGNDFSFAITINGDTLIQRGIEKVESAGINRINTEEYVRMKK